MHISDTKRDGLLRHFGGVVPLSYHGHVNDLERLWLLDVLGEVDTGQQLNGLWRQLTDPLGIGAVADTKLSWMAGQVLPEWVVVPGTDRNSVEMNFWNSVGRPSVP